MLTRLGLAVSLAIVLPATSVTTAGAQAAEQLGRTPANAALSCWDLKQQDPAAADGTYWLLTPMLQAPQQFYCDMTTDGGGWVLIGRGREGWELSYNGQGPPDEVHTTIDGPGAFTPRALPAPTIDALLNGTRPDELTDGVRLRRATGSDGADRQEVRFTFTDRDRWVWTFGAQHPIDSFRFDSTTGGSGHTASFGTSEYYNRVVTTKLEGQSWNMGFAFGSNVRGSSSTTSYLWSSDFWTGNALPFTQVFLRPRLTEAEVAFPEIPDEGQPADAQRPLLANLSQPSTWGVTGRANGSSSELDTEVQAFAEAGGRMLVGGNFRYVQRGANATGDDRVEQPRLAAFDRDTGDWLADFRPTLNGQVEALHLLPSGSVVVAGDFTEVNQTPAPGIVALDPVTGAIDPTFRVAVENRITGQTLAVTALDAHGPWLYLGGRFTHLTGGTRTNPVYARAGARVSITDGTPDPDWNPALLGTVLDLDASDHGDRVYFAGYFDEASGQPAEKIAIVSTEPGAALVPGLGEPQFSARSRYQQAVREVGDRVWHGGSEHMLFSYTRDGFSLLSGNITRIHGDFQAIHDHDGVVYGSCHCDDWNYSDSYQWSWSNLIPDWSQADNIRWVGAWDAATGEYLPEFLPALNSTEGQGPWAMFTDSTGTVWVGGNLTQSRAVGWNWQWIGGFARFAPRDSTAPTTPRSLSGTHEGSTTTLRWEPSSDDRGPIRYEVILGNRVVATTGAREFTIDSPPGITRYFVRAVDGAGNRSATTPVHHVVAPK